MGESMEDRIELRRGDPEAEARMRALSSPLRLRVLRLCAFEARTNKELAELLGLNPGTMLHHVRTLVQTGYLAAEPERSGAQGAREVPYRATGLSWRTSMPGGSPVLIETFLQQIEGVDPEDLDATWLGLKLNAEHKTEFQQRLYELVNEFKERGPDADGDTYSFFSTLHPDHNPSTR
ncbi:winged helix-turn-helix domain-containing protein [Microbacterium hibisci]|uniref:winged helix-turn-helix domain-containing protein n=1 Tax=Microbacterium hibisci TaxID=2036000 RepID=UPI0027DA5E95|nr:winged helix-turn-helix domain-containing protein [Microbacterium hibisci]